MQNWIASNIGHILTSITILSGVITWLVSQAFSRKQNLVAQTAALLSATTTEEHISTADFVINSKLNDGIELRKDSIDKETEAALFLMLNYYEYLCSLADIEVIDRRTLLHLRGGLMRQTFIASKPYIEWYRITQKRNEIYEKLERLAMFSE